MILGDICTRSCKFCNVRTGKPQAVDLNEPVRIAESVSLLGIKHLVLTSVDRDDLDDLGAGIWETTLLEVKKLLPPPTIEALIPDFQGKEHLIKRIVDTRIEVISHNLETVRRLTPSIRSVANYDRSLQVLNYIAKSGISSKTGIMLGLGEQKEEVIQTMQDAYDAGCKIFTIGQYLQPSPRHLPVTEYIHPDVFEEYRLTGLAIGLKYVESSPLVRSSYHAERHIH
jgi:lipoic acid synthetase